MKIILCVLKLRQKEFLKRSIRCQWHYHTRIILPKDLILFGWYQEISNKGVFSTFFPEIPGTRGPNSDNFKFSDASWSYFGGARRGSTTGTGQSLSSCAGAVRARSAPLRRCTRFDDPFFPSKIIPRSTRNFFFRRRTIFLSTFSAE